MEVVVNKAQQKRDRQVRESLNCTLRNKLRFFENDYLNSSVEWEINKAKKSLADVEQQIADFPHRIMTHKNRHDTMNSLQRLWERQEEVLTLDSRIKLRAINDAKKSYDSKVEKLVDLLIQEGFSNSKYKVEDIDTAGELLEFLITKSDKAVHARLIWVDVIEKAPHFRFITTIREIK